MLNEHDPWFLLQFKPNSHNLAVHNLRRQGFGTFLPLQQITRPKSSRFVKKIRPLFPGYLFVSFNPEHGVWQKIRNTLGVSHLVSFNEIPKVVPNDLVSELMSRCDKSGIFSPNKSVKENQMVNFVAGPFTNFIGKIEKMESNERALVLLEILGRKTRLSAQIEQLERLG